MSKSTWFGLLVGFGAILLGNAWEDGHLSSLVQGPAFLIVVGGTLGAVLVSNTGRDLKLAMEMFWQAFREETDEAISETIKDIVECSKIAKRDSLVAIEGSMKGFKDPFFKKILRNVIAGIDAQIIRDTFEVEIEADEERMMGAAKVWSDAGGFSPTIGIIGAVLGLIHVMGNLTDPSNLGGGIAVAFVATIYGIAFANLIFLPIGNKIKKQIQERVRHRRLILEGSLLINQGLPPSLVDQKLRAYLDQPLQVEG